MNILIRNSARVAECVLLHTPNLPDADLLEHPEVKTLIGNRHVLDAEFYEDRLTRTWVVDLDLANK